MYNDNDSVFLPNEEYSASQREDQEKDFMTAFREFRATRIPFTKEETQLLIEWIVANRAFHLLEGDAIWKRMEASGRLTERSWQSMKTHFHNNVLSSLDELKITFTNRRKLEACFRNSDEIDFFGDTDMDSDSDLFSGNVLLHRPKNRTKRKTSNNDKRQSSEEEDVIETLGKRPKFPRKMSKIPAEKFNESMRSSASSRPSMDKDLPDDEEGNGVEPGLEALVDNINIPPQLRDLSSSSSNLLEISKAASESTRRVSETTESNKAQVGEIDEGILKDNGKVDDLPSAAEFSAGLMEAGSRFLSLSQERERSVLGVTSTIRNDEDEGGDSPPVFLKV